MTLGILLAALTLAGCGVFIANCCTVLRPRPHTLDWVALQERKPFTFAVRRHRMERWDAVPAVIITAAYAVTAFFQLGSTLSPQTTADFAGGKSVTVELSEMSYVSKIWYFPALGTGGYNLEISKDGESWSTLWTRTEKDEWGRDKTVYYWAQAEDYAPSYALKQSYDKLFKWVEIQPENAQNFRYLRIRGRAEREVLQLGKLLLLDQNGAFIQVPWTASAGAPAELETVLAVDETVPEAISWRNSTYFDEIYHARTALEHIQGIYPYEITHPPLGKLILGLGIRLFGMTPFGWRFMGTLFGVGMLPLLYILLKNLFGKTVVATCGTTLFAAEFMHLTQTRIATIDTYGVFFILLAYLFFYRWLTASATPDRRGRTGEGYGSLALSGLFWGIGVACKWTVIYAGAGLALLYLIHMILRIRAWPMGEDARPMAPWLGKTLLLSVACFVVVPLCIYTASYIPYAQARGEVTLAAVWDEMWRNQGYMLTYHQGVHEAHPYSSSWFQWIVDARPILYYSQQLPGGKIEEFSSFNNPVLSWAGLLAILMCIFCSFRRRWAKLTAMAGLGVGAAALCAVVGRVENGPFDPALAQETVQYGSWSFSALTLSWGVLLLGLAVYLGVGTALALECEERYSGKCAFIAVGFAAQFLPWLLVGRITFAYHYFPSTLFLVLAVCLLFDQLMDSPRANWRVPVYGLTALAVALYLLFYPGLIGLTMPTDYARGILKFLPSWPM